MEARGTGFSSFGGSSPSRDDSASPDERPSTADSSAGQPSKTSSPAAGPVVSKSKEPISTEDIPVTIVPASSNSSDRMTEMPEGDEGWRAYYEHPLTAATTAMLNINGANEEQNSGMSLLYEYYKLPGLEKVDKSDQEKYSPLPDIWSATLTSQATSDAVDRTSKHATTNGQVDSDVDVYLGSEGCKSENGDSPTVNGIKGEPVSPKPSKLSSLLNGEESSSPIRVKQEQLSPEVSSPTPVDLVSVPLPPVTTVVTRQVIDSNKNREMQAVGATVVSLGDTSPNHTYGTQVYANISQSPYPDGLTVPQYGVLTNVVPVSSPSPPQYSSQSSRTVYTLTPSDCYRDYYSSSDQYQTVRQHLASYSDPADNTFVDRFIRHNSNYKTSLHALAVDLHSPDSGIGDTTITPRDSSGLPQIFEYNELPQTQTLLHPNDPQTTPTIRTGQTQSNRKSWHDYGRNSETDKIQIPKLHSDTGFRYYLESPISTSQRREDDRISYINKGQFYGITVEYIPDPDKPLRSPTVKSVVMLVFREEKSHEDENKAWQFWHSRQHSVKQRILDADTKNSSGIIGQIEEITHNAIAFYWNPMESPAKVNIAVQCLSTDFSNQKGVKGLPLHLQIDTFDEYRENSTPTHRGYCQIKVFCDKGAERKTRDEERRAAKRKMSATGSGRKKIEEMYHPPCDRSEFYSMSDLLKPPVLFTPTEDLDKVTNMDLGFYGNHTPVTEDSNGGLDHRETPVDVRSNVEIALQSLPPAKRIKTFSNDRVMLYARQETEDIYHALHLVPPTLVGLSIAIESKYNIQAKNIRNIYKRCKKGITVQLDDDIIKHYCNEDTFLIEISAVAEEEMYDIILVEL
ncbi:protein grainyhead-like isoform X1 [Centruroides vittatus]|uniref:protein grainyhead-like isoform X1 n=2 Tax=Centruroides vittatus TaxID=120091 RepID=UPI00350EA7B2